MKYTLFYTTIWTQVLLVFCGSGLIIRPAVADRHIIPLPPEHEARRQRSYAEYISAKMNLQAKNYTQAEEGFRSSIADFPDDRASLGLAETLVAEGKVTEALQTYYLYFHPPVGEFQSDSYAPKANLEYAMLLNQQGQWAEAIDHYNAALPDLVKWDYKANLHFDAATPQPAALAAASHIGLGLYDNFEYEPDSNTKALQEYNAALQLAPDWDAANYYYGYGWQKLSPIARAKFGTMQQAKPHLQKAENVGDASIKAAAAKVLKALG